MAPSSSTHKRTAANLGRFNHQDTVFILGPNGHEVWEMSGTPDTQGKKPPPNLVHYLSPIGRANLAYPPGPSWTVADVELALAYVLGHRF